MSKYSKQLKNVDDSCFQQQNIRVYLQFFGKKNINTGDYETFQFDRPLKFSAVDDIIIVTTDPNECPDNIQFKSPIVVLSPNVETCERITNCNQIVNIVENSVYLDINAFQSIRITPGTIIEASNDQLIIITPDFCEIPENIIELVKSGKINVKRTIVADVAGAGSVPCTINDPNFYDCFLNP